MMHGMLTNFVCFQKLLQLLELVQECFLEERHGRILLHFLRAYT